MILILLPLTVYYCDDSDFLRNFYLYNFEPTPRFLRNCRYII